MRRLLPILLVLGCASAHAPGVGWTFAVGADAHAEIQAAPACTSGGIRTVVREQEGVKHTFAADKPAIKTTTTEPAGQTEPIVLQESHGSAFLEPLVKVIGATGAAFGNAAGSIVVCVITLGWRCGP